MNPPKFEVIYYVDGTKIISNAVENAHYAIRFNQTKTSFEATLIPKEKITLYRVNAVFGYAFAEGDKFFGNGYQAWSTSKEYAKTDSMRDVTAIAVNSSLKKLAGVSGDVRFVSCPKKAGEFYSHTYTYIKHLNNSIELFGSLTEQWGFTVIYADFHKGLLTFSKDVEGVTTDAPYEVFQMYMTSGNYDNAFDRYFKTMGLKKPAVTHMSGYTSWYNYFQNINEKIILRDLNATKIVKDSVSIFQVDDGYETFVGDWLDYNPEKFPRGMKFIADEIHQKGYQAGLWLAPFNLQKASRMYKEHPDWVIRDKNGKPLMGVVAWGGAYAMDIDNPEARAYIKKVLTTVVNDWGYDMVKLDFLYSICMEPRNNKSRGTLMHEGMAFLRECCGNKLILGCGVPLGSAFGFVDACRTGCDVDLTYAGKYYNRLHINNEIPSAQNSINNAIFRRHLNGRAFCNDPDVFFLRYSNLTFTTRQKLLLGSINHLFGGVLFVSDDMGEYGHEDIKAVQKFFAKSNVKILSADYESEEVIAIRVLQNNEEKMLRFNLRTGENTFPEFMGLSPIRNFADIVYDEKHGRI